MVKVIMVSAEGRKTDLFPESMTIREVLEELEADDSCQMIAVNGACLREEELEKELREVSEKSVVYLSSIPKPEKVIREETREERLNPQNPAAEPVPDAGTADRVKETQEVVVALVKWIGKALIRFMPALLAASGIVFLILMGLGRDIDYRKAYFLVGILFVCGNFFWIFSNEHFLHRKKEEDPKSRKE